MADNNSRTHLSIILAVVIILIIGIVLYKMLSQGTSSTSTESTTIKIETPVNKNSPTSSE